MPQIEKIQEHDIYSRTGNVLCYLCFAGAAFSIAVDSFTAIAFSLFFIVAVVARRSKTPNIIYKYGIALVLVFVLVSLSFSGEFTNNIPLLKKFWRILLPFGIFIALSLNENLLFRCLNIMLVFLVLNTFIGIVQRHTGFDLTYLQPILLEEDKGFNSTGTFSHHLTYAGVMLLTFPVYLSLIFSEHISGKAKKFYLAGAVILFIAMIYSLSRSALLASAISIFMLLLLNKKIKILMIASVFVVILASGLFLIKKYSPETIASTESFGRLTNISPQFGDDRFYMWEAAWGVINEHFLFGQGADITPLENEYERIETRNSEERQRSWKFNNQARVGVHNIYLQLWLDYGFFVLLSYLLMWAGIAFTAIVAIRRKNSATMKDTHILTGIIAALLGFFFMGLFENNFYDGELNHIVMMWIGVSAYIVEKIRQHKKTRL